MNHKELSNLILSNISNIGEFNLVTDPSGSLEFISEKENLYEIYATPNWINEGELQVEVYINEDLIREKTFRYSRMTKERYEKIIRNEIKYLKKNKNYC